MAITRFTCVNVCSLNCLNLFLKYKIGRLVLGLMCLTFLLLRDVFEVFKMMFGSLVVLHAWLHSYLCFSLIEKLFLSNLDTFRYLAYLLRFSVDLLSQSRHLSIARWIDREISCLLNTSSIHRVCFAVDTWTTGSIPLNTSICRDLLRFYK